MTPKIKIGMSLHKIMDKCEFLQNIANPPPGKTPPSPAATMVGVELAAESISAHCATIAQILRGEL